MGLRIGMTYNVKTEWTPGPDDPPDLNAEFDHEDTIRAIERALASGGHEVMRIGNARQLLERMPDLGVDIVFNIAEGYEGRNRESQVPILLEMIGVPFVGADGLTLGLTLDKILSKKVLLAEGIPTPRFAEFSALEELNALDLRYPLIVKLRYEGTSKGLTTDSVVDSPEQLRRQAARLMESYRGFSVFVEEFIEGQEFTVCLIGNGMPTPYPVVQIQLDGKTDLGRLFYTFDHVRQQHRSRYMVPAAIPEPLARDLQALALRTYRAVDCRDFGRVDFRVDRDGRPHVLEINPLPSLSLEDAYRFVAEACELTYDQIVCRILDAALVRCGLKSQTEVSLPSPTLLR
ncbi:MAG TPA: ATP-grasp domain-containing protein [bacterium]